MCDCPLQDPRKLEEKLKPYSSKIEQFQAMIFWRNPIAMAGLLILVNAIFAIVGVLHLTFVPTVLLLLTLKTIGKLIVLKFGEKIGKILFKPIENKDEGTYKIYPLEKICDFIACIFKKIDKVCPFKRCCEKELTLASAAIPLLVLTVLFIFFLIVGTYFLNLVVVNLALLLPVIIFHPAVLAKLQPYIAKCQKTD